MHYTVIGLNKMSPLRDIILLARCRVLLPDELHCICASVTDDDDDDRRQRAKQYCPLGGPVIICN